MRLALQTVLCCCAFSALLPPVRGTTGELDTILEERFKVWLQSRVKRDICGGSLTGSEQLSDVHAAPRQEDNATSVSPPPSCGLLLRSRRSTSKPSGCRFVTCVYHDLIHQLHQIHQIKSCAPVKKIGSGGYGRRRRRSLLDDAWLALRTRRQRRSTEDASKGSSAAGIPDNSCRSPPSDP
uniref:Adrenomedullin n=1 Tax=Gasterosteus aculeatus aculeatus TaxID=481459 RepID=A0AAQ4RQK2_GASAC|nr:pro-adrenomedullin-like [Gasterosteus aculeatus aculeatus]